ncbi:MAG: hypothetical protein RLO48_01625, partial [Bauldia litoralis]
AEERATAVSRMLTENTSSATKGVIDNFENMSRTASAEGLKATEAIRMANAALIEEISGSVTLAAKNFGEATKEMRGAMQEVQRDLDQTRAELKRGVLEMPEETRESAEAMRRVVGDQIKALSELSDIIARHGKTLDVYSPSLGEARATPIHQIEMPAAAVAATAGGAPARSAPPPAAPPAPQARHAGNGNGHAEVSRPATPPVQPAPQAQQPRPAPTRQPATPPAPPTGAAPEPAQDEARAEGGWVSDLLRRASRDEEGGSPDPAPTPAAPGVNGNGTNVEADQPLNALSVDIARAIDHDASVELWARHGRGEQNLFTRRLYTLQGQQTFDEIRKKYQRDEKFRTAVDRYVSDFEKLLAEVARKNKNDKNANKSYLISDTGKVYTMLAHASGRFD